MQYADIALPVKVVTKQESFTYRIPPALLADIRLGQRVTVPFRRKELIGTVVGLRSTPPRIKGTLKELTGLVEPFPIFDRPTLELARQVAQKYGATIGQVLEDAAPKPAKRLAKKLDSGNTEPSTQGADSSRFGLYDVAVERYRTYLELINKSRQSKKQSLVLFPNQELVEHFAAVLREEGIETTVIPPTLELSEHYAAWVAGVTARADVIIGTRKAIFLSLPRLRLIIIDTPSEFGYKEEQFPYYHAVSVAKLKAELSHAHLVLGDAAPRLEEWQEYRERKLALLPTRPRQGTITLVDTTTHRGLISEVLKEHIGRVHEQNGRIAIYYNRRGSGRFYRCLECETAIYCERCDTLLTVYEEEGRTTLRCSNCNFETTPPYRCQVCQSYSLGTVGLGVESVAAILREHFPEISIGIGGESEWQAKTLTVWTAQLFSQPPIKPFDLLATFYVDQLLHGSQWNAREVAYLTLSHLAERTKHLLIHSAEPEHPVIRAVCSEQRELFYDQELTERKTHGYPPTAPVLKLTLSGNKEEAVRQQAQTLYEQYRSIVPNPAGVFPPSPVGTGKRRDKYRYQVIIKSPLTRLILDHLPSDWQIDPEPTDL